MLCSWGKVLMLPYPCPYWGWELICQEWELICQCFHLGRDLKL